MTPPRFQFRCELKWNVTFGVITGSVWWQFSQCFWFSERTWGVSLPSWKSWWLESGYDGSYLCNWSSEWHLGWSRGRPEKAWVLIHIFVQPTYGIASALSGQRWLLWPSSFWVWTACRTSCRSTPPTSEDCVQSLSLPAFPKPPPAVHSRLIPGKPRPSGRLWVLSAGAGHNKPPEPILLGKARANAGECKEIKAPFSFHAPILQYLAYSLGVLVLTRHGLPRAIQRRRTEWRRYVQSPPNPCNASECHRPGQQWQSSTLAFSPVSHSSQSHWLFWNKNCFSSASDYLWGLAAGSGPVVEKPYLGPIFHMLLRVPWWVLALSGPIAPPSHGVSFFGWPPPCHRPHVHVEDVAVTLHQTFPHSPS